jgi:agmatinase
VQIGIRSYSAEEAQFIRENPGRLSVWSPERIREAGEEDFHRHLRAALDGRLIYLTLDVDGLDPSVVPATGTPEPDGLGWAQTCAILKTVASAGTVVAMDCVELAPREGLHTSEFSVAKLLYKCIGYCREKTR